MKTYQRIALFIALTALCLTGFVACKGPSLAPGGAYTTSITNTVGTNTVITTTSDLQLYQADASFRVAYNTLDTLFQFERNNRQYLWNLSPAIKHTLDKIRPEAWSAVQEYTAARQAYLSNPTPAGLTGVDAIVAKVQQLLVASTAALGTQTTVGTNSVNTLTK